MALRALVSVFASDNAICLSASCEIKPYQDLIVTKCNHIFCKACLEESLARKKECPLCKGELLDIEEGQTEYTSFKSHLDRFTYYVSNDLSTLQNKMETEKVWHSTSCEKLKEASVKKSPGGDQADSNDNCSICLAIPFQMYFITKDEDISRVGRHMHEGCWQETVASGSTILDISVHDLVKVAKQLPTPTALPPKPAKPASPFKVFFVAIILPISIWALAMNARIYNNKDTFLFLLSIPALVIFKSLSLLLSGIKAVLTEKPT